MGTYNLTATRSAEVRYYEPSSNFSTDSLFKYVDGGQYLLVGFPAFPAELYYKTVTALDYYAYFNSRTGGLYLHLTASALQGQWVENAVTWYTKPLLGTRKTSYIQDANVSGYKLAYATNQFSKTVFDYGINLEITTLGDISTTRAAAEYRPYCKITYSDTTVTGVIQSPSPSTGYVPKTKDNTFLWSIGKSGECYGDITQTSATFRWRAAAGQTENEISCGTTMSCTVPANTFATDSVQWQVIITTNTGETLTSDWYTLSTQETTSTATIVEPKSAVLDGSIINRFRWQHIISTGTTQTAADLQSSADKTTWTTLGPVSGANTYYDVPANTFAAGQRYWRVRTYNTDNVAGTWSDAASFIVVAAPAAPTVSAVQTPRPLIAWQSTGQQGYQIAVGDYDSGLVFGVDNSHKLPVYLPDGAYTVRVRIQNEYSLWSEWGSCPLTVANTPGDAITLTATNDDGDAVLSWTGGTASEYWIYRDNALIATASSTTYVDCYALGETAYKVRAISDADDNYTDSSIATVELAVSYPKLRAIGEDGEWISLELSGTQTRTHTIARSAGVSYMHFAGATYPSAEISEFEDASYKLEVAFATRVEALRFEALIGLPVCIKNTEGDVIIGMMSQFVRSQSRESYRYAMELTRIEIEV